MHSVSVSQASLLLCRALSKKWGRKVKKLNSIVLKFSSFLVALALLVGAIILSLFILTSCNLRINAREEAEDIVATVIEYINKRDSEGLIALFCEEVKGNYELTADVDILFNMFDGEITSYEVSAVASGEKSELFGKSSYSITGIVEAYVDDKEYRIEVSKTIYNDQKPQRVGITTVMAKDENVKGMFFVGEVNVFTYGRR